MTVLDSQPDAECHSRGISAHCWAVNEATDSYFCRLDDHFRDTLDCETVSVQDGTISDNVMAAKVKSPPNL